jgi:cell division septum initiation protein DivIVA
MSDEVSKFCDDVHGKLETLEGRMDSLKLNIGTTWHSLQEKLDEVRHKGEATKQAVAEARANLEQWVIERKAEAKGTIDQWVEDRETQKLAARAQEAEECAGIAIVIALASIDDAERMVLEAIAARRDAEAVTVG